MTNSLPTPTVRTRTRGNGLRPLNTGTPSRSLFAPGEASHDRVAITVTGSVLVQEDLLPDVLGSIDCRGGSGPEVFTLDGGRPGPQGRRWDVRMRLDRSRRHDRWHFAVAPGASLMCYQQGRLTFSLQLFVNPTRWLGHHLARGCTLDALRAMSPAESLALHQDTRTRWRSSPSTRATTSFPTQ
jgi:hypothetical protein